jgi:hypothetical protein
MGFNKAFLATALAAARNPFFKKTLDSQREYASKVVLLLA